MCCRLILLPSPSRDLLTLLLPIAGFDKVEEFKDFWMREIRAEQTSVRARISEQGLELSLYPSVTNYVGHANKRLAAGLMFQTAALLAEKVGAAVSQHATVEGCLAERPSVVVVAHYPLTPLRYEFVCKGFREVLLPQIGDVA